jgi:xanthine dehydrogenase accessory factor
MWLERLHAWAEQGVPCALATVTESEGSAPRKAGAKLVLNAHGEIEGSIGGGAIEHRCLQEAARVLASGAASTLRFVLDADWREMERGDPAGTLGGSVTVFIEPVLPSKEVVVFGAGHIAERLGRLCEVVGLGFRVYDPRPEFARRERFPQAREVVCAAYDDIEAHLRLSSVSHCVVLTHGHAQDEQVLGQLLGMPILPYIGMVGSSKKIRGIRERLAAKGLSFGPHVYTPAGLALGGNLPGDIALAILAEIKLLMEGGRPGHLGQ